MPEPARCFTVPGARRATYSRCAEREPRSRATRAGPSSDPHDERTSPSRPSRDVRQRPVRRARRAIRAGLRYAAVHQTVIVALRIGVNAVAFGRHWDPYLFILLNLAFSTQAAYAAPLILLAQTRQAERDKTTSDADARHREDIAQKGLQHQQTAEQGIALLRSLIEENTRLTTEVNRLTAEIHERVAADA